MIYKRKQHVDLDTASKVRAGLDWVDLWEISATISQNMIICTYIIISLTAAVCSAGDANWDVPTK